MAIRVFLIICLLLMSPSILQVARCEPDPDAEVVESAEEGDIGIIGEDAQDFGGGSFGPAPGVETVCVFPKNPSKLVAAGEESELLVGIKNEGDSSINVIAIHASVHPAYDPSYLLQNLSAQEKYLINGLFALTSPILYAFGIYLPDRKNYNMPREAFNNASVPPSAQATFPYLYAVSKFLQSGAYVLMGTIVYEIDQHPYQSTFYNGTIEVTEPGGLLSVESVFLFCLAAALIGLLGFWIRSQIQEFSKKTKKGSKVEVGTKTTDVSMDEWLQGTAYTRSQANQSKKKK